MLCTCQAARLRIKAVAADPEIIDLVRRAAATSRRLCSVGAAAPAEPAAAARAALG